MSEPDRSLPTADAPSLPTEVQLAVDALDDKRAKDIVVLDLTGIAATLDFFVIASGEGSLQLQALEEAVKERLKEAGIRPKGVESPSDRWALLDYGAVIVHLMSPDARAFYDLESLWADAERVEVAPT